MMLVPSSHKALMGDDGSNRYNYSNLSVFCTKDSTFQHKIIIWEVDETVVDGLGVDGLGVDEKAVAKSRVDEPGINKSMLLPQVATVGYSVYKYWTGVCSEPDCMVD